MNLRRLYLDACALQRPLDRLLTARERSEAECVMLLLDAVERGRVELVWSSPLTFETIRRGPPMRAEAARRIRMLATHQVGLSDDVAKTARSLQAKAGLQALDALHLACAQAARATLVTVDARFLRAVRRCGFAAPVVCDPIEAASLLAS